MQNKFGTYLCCFIMLAYGVVLSIIGPLLSDISKDYSLSLGQMGLFISINFIGFLSFVYIGGILAEKFGKKNITTISLIGLSLSLFMFGFSSTLYLEFIAIFLIGGFGGIIESVVCSLIADLNPLNKDHYINFAQIFLCTGVALGPLLTILIIRLGYNWRINYYILSVLFLILFCSIVTIKVKENQTSEKILLKDLKGILFDNKFVIVCICMLLYTGCEVSVWGWMSTFSQKGMALSRSAAAFYVFAFWISMTIGRIVCGKLIRLFKIRNIIIVLAFLSALTVMISGFIKVGIIAWVVAIGLGFSFSSLYPFLLAVGSSRKSNATSFAVMVGSGGIGAIIIPFFTGIIGEHMGVQIALMSPSILLLIIALLFIFDNPRGKSEGNKEAL
jgi:fucose permease